jgi:hypothetical protein
MIDTTTPPPLMEYIPRLSPEMRPPYHLSEYCALLERACTEPVRALVTEPIRHWKTETTLHAVVRMLEHDPTRRAIVLCHSFERAKWLGKRLRELAERTNSPGYPGRSVGPARGWNTIEHWQNEHGGGVLIMSADQSREGFDCHVLICDDPIDEHGAESRERRDEVDRSIEYYTSRCKLRDGRSGPVIIVMSRFHTDDPIGRRMARRAVQWTTIHHPAIIGLGTSEERAFAPEVWPLEELRRWRAERAEFDARERLFWARLQGEPLPDTMSYFHSPTRYDAMPTWPGYRDAIGIDMSFSRARRADWAAAVVTRWWRHGRSGRSECYVRTVLRFRADLGELIARVQSLLEEYGRMPIYTYTSGPERAAIDAMAMYGIRVSPMHASAPKFVRAQRTIDDHNAGRILWPNEPWVDSVYRRMQDFRGNEEDPDDEIDALVSVHDAMAYDAAGGGTRTLGEWRY